MPPKRSATPAAQAKASSSQVTSNKREPNSQLRKLIKFNAEIIFTGCRFKLDPAAKLKDFEKRMKEDTLRELNRICGCELQEEDLWGDPEQIDWDPELPNSSSTTVGSFCPDNTLTVTLYPASNRIVQARPADPTAAEYESTLDIVESHVVETEGELVKTKQELATTQTKLATVQTKLATTKTELATTKTEFSNMKAGRSRADARVEVLLADKDLKYGDIKKRFSIFMDKKVEEARRVEFEAEQEASEGRLMRRFREELRKELEQEREERRKELEQEREERRKLERELEREREERQRDVEGLYEVLRPIRLRVLLDKTRDRFSKDLNFKSWSKLSKQNPVDDYVITHLSGPYRPPDDAIRWCLNSTNPVRGAGNKRAHLAEDEDIRKAVKSMPDEMEDKGHIKALFTYAYRGASL